jgi:hypothetical protein
LHQGRAEASADHDSAVQRALVIAFPGENVEARATLLPDLAPQTCEAVWATLPVRGQARHAIYSGSEVYLILPELMRLPPENTTTRGLPGDVAFGWFAAAAQRRALAELLSRRGLERPCETLVAWAREA